MSPESSYLIIAGAALWALIALTALAGVAAIYTRMEARILRARHEAPTGPLEGPEVAPPGEEPGPEVDWEEGWRIAAARVRRERREEDTREEPEEPSEGLPADST